MLFELARFHAPSTIFMDELESIMEQRAGFGTAGYVSACVIVFSSCACNQKYNGIRFDLMHLMGLRSLSLTGRIMLSVV